MAAEEIKIEHRKLTSNEQKYLNNYISSSKYINGFGYFFILIIILIIEFGGIFSSSRYEKLTFIIPVTIIVFSYYVYRRIKLLKCDVKTYAVNIEGDYSFTSSATSNSYKHYIGSYNIEIPKHWDLLNLLDYGSFHKCEAIPIALHGFERIFFGGAKYKFHIISINKKYAIDKENDLSEINTKFNKFVFLSSIAGFIYIMFSIYYLNSAHNPGKFFNYITIAAKKDSAYLNVAEFIKSKPNKGEAIKIKSTYVFPRLDTYLALRTDNKMVIDALTELKEDLQIREEKITKLKSFNSTELAFKIKWDDYKEIDNAIKYAVMKDRFEEIGQELKKNLKDLSAIRNSLLNANRMKNECSKLIDNFEEKRLNYFLNDILDNNSGNTPVIIENYPDGLSTSSVYSSYSLGNLISELKKQREISGIVTYAEYSDDIPKEIIIDCNEYYNPKLLYMWLTIEILLAFLFMFFLIFTINNYIQFKRDIREI